MAKRVKEIYFMMKNVINDFPYKAKSVVPEIYYIAKIYIDLTYGLEHVLYLFMYLMKLCN